MKSRDEGGSATTEVFCSVFLLMAQAKQPLTEKHKQLYKITGRFSV